MKNGSRTTQLSYIIHIVHVIQYLALREWICQVIHQGTTSSLISNRNIFHDKFFYSDLFYMLILNSTSVDNALTKAFKPCCEE